jgi:hypothetical protein
MALILPRSEQQAALACLSGLLLFAGQALAANILFIGNSFTYAQGSPVRYYRPETVTDVNGSGQGGVPALFKSFTYDGPILRLASMRCRPQSSST